MKTTEHERIVRSTRHFESLAADPAFKNDSTMHEHDVPMTGLFWGHSHGGIVSYHKHKMEARLLKDEEGRELPATFWDWKVLDG